MIAHDRRGHGRSTQTWDGNEMDTYADDLACLIDHLDLTGLTLVGHSTGGGEVVRYIGRHGSGRVAKLVLVSAVPPLMLRTDDNPGGLPLEVFDGHPRGRGIRPLAAVPRPRRRAVLRQQPQQRRVAGRARRVLAAGPWRAATGPRTRCIAAFSATDFRDDLAQVDVPTLVIHGDDDQIVPFEVGGRRSAAAIAGATLTVYENGAHGLPDTERDRLHADLLAFIDS